MTQIAEAPPKHLLDRSADRPTRQSMTATEAGILQLAPGAGSLLAYTALAAVMSGLGVPNMLTLMLAILIAEVPISWTIMIRRVRRETGGGFSLKDAFPWHRKVPAWVYALIGVPVVLLSTAVIVGLNPPIESALLSGPFAWVPEWFVLAPDPNMFGQLSRGALLAMWGMGLVGGVIVGGFTQELFARGFLLPRTEHLGAAAPAFNATMFAVFHLIAPWGWVGFFIIALPWAYLVWWRRSVKIGLFCHVGMLGLQWLALTMMVFGLAPTQG